ncbi:patched domain-containing protein 3-like isoform X2 [Anneissia japonica]|uniref:patched domain-containing protein 3-like isoform X2 n=1 Tax=Anneissia japonica TaxID=1529436 RepID=UPI001425A4BD|nr:patched domain-containing protein 3-like isoform X2 [Anneissia japonica]
MSCRWSLFKSNTGYMLRIGSFVGRYPIACIIVSIVITMGFGGGIAMLKNENRRENLWVPSGSDNQDYRLYVTEYYKDPFFETLIFENDNILTPESLKSMLKVDEKIKAINVGRNWESICFRLGDSCFVSSILELWGFNKTIIDGLSQQDILDKINEPNPISLVTFREVNVASMLGGVDDETYIRVAKTAVSTYGVIDKSVFDESKGKYVDKDAEDWELKFIEIGTDDYEDMTVYCLATSSFDIESGGSIGGDTYFLAGGYGLLFIYIAVMLSNFTLIEHKVYIALSGVTTVGLAVVVSIGFGSYLGLIYTPVHSILPFLLLGIGVDDMFVIVQAWSNLSEGEKKKPVHEQCSLALKHAGVSITVTSITDFSAFVIGATTILPALRSFCLYCGIGILFLFIFSILFFTATLSLDQRRINSRRNACCCCIQYGDDYEPSECGQKNRFQRFFEVVYAPFLMKTPVKVVVLIITACFLGFGIWGFIELEQFFDFRWFLPADSYATEFIDASELYYPQGGLSSGIYLNNIDMFRDRSTVDALYNNVKDEKYVDSSSFSNWYEEFGQWIEENKANEQEYNNLTMWPDTEQAFQSWVQEFLRDPMGGVTYTSDVIINDESNTFEIITSRITFQHVVFKGSKEEVEAMDSIQALVDSYDFEGDGYAFAYSQFYLDYETNKVIQDELYRNMGLACLCVFVVILLLLANLQACCLVFLSVFLTLIDLAGFIHHWGLTIDTVVTIQLILSIGIAVDYAAHIGHTFLTVTGTKNERARKAITDIGPAVFNGGFSTLLAFVLLSLSSSYIFRTFFKIFFLVVLFGLFHGLVLLPVLLSWIGPAPYASAVQVDAAISTQNGSVKSNSSKDQSNNATNGTIVNSGSPSEKANFDNPAYDGEVASVPLSAEEKLQMKDVV